MVLIKGGSFIMGSDNAGDEQRGAHSESVGSFYIDKTEVTNEEYSAFVKATGHRVPTNEVPNVNWWKPWNGKEPPSGREKWPVSNVSARDAETFAQWLSKSNPDGYQYRLPTEAEWEFAARNGVEASLFPWGNSWDDTRANLNGRPNPVNVGSFPRGATATGVLDMVGNVWEWTSSKASFYDSRRIESKDEEARVRRGGSFAEKIDVHFYNTTDRPWFGDADYKFPTIGFRLVREAK
jgi:formylglycine-generating enzyme required for sulfatase activity